ncbi:MAG: DUF1015 domain-containing protein [Pseudomonadota bacterium]
MTRRFFYPIMAIIAPFRGLTYDFNAFSDPSLLMAPPYDVISEEEQNLYYQANPFNVIRLVLGRNKTGDSDWDNRYTRAADRFNRWKSEDILIRRDLPAMYLTSLTYNPGDGSDLRVRWGMICLVRIEEEDAGVILPHERTFSAHKDDRLKLMRACNAQLSQIFGLYEDPVGNVHRFFEGVRGVKPQVDFDFRDGTNHKMWIIQDRGLFKKVAETMGHKAVFIADGHHRYETARNYRNLMRARYGRRPINRSYEYVMMYLTSMDDAGLTILPSHRLIKATSGFQAAPFFDRIKPWFETETISPSGSSHLEACLSLKRRLEEKGRTTNVIGFRHHGDGAFYLLSLKPGAEETLEDLHPSLKKLDVILLSRLLLQRGLGFTREDLDNEKIFHYESNLAKAVSEVDTGSCQMTFILNPTKMAQVREVAGNALIMPRKSTYFYPKVLTGMVFNQIDPHEIIQLQ